MSQIKSGFGHVYTSRVQNSINVGKGVFDPNKIKWVEDSSGKVFVGGSRVRVIGNGKTVIVPPTPPEPPTPTGLVIGGREYPIVDMPDGRTWIGENLDFIWTGLIVGQSGASWQESRANYYNNDESTYGVNGNKYGLMYNGVAVEYLEANKSTLFPGWHVATSTEWLALKNAMPKVGEWDGYYRLHTETGWADYWNNGDGTYQFNLPPGGWYNGSSFIKVGEETTLYSSTTRGQYDDLVMIRDQGDGSLNDSVEGYMYECYVRLIKDSE